jgi:hypothetical protein
MRRNPANPLHASVGNHEPIVAQAIKVTQRCLYAKNRGGTTDLETNQTFGRRKNEAIKMLENSARKAPHYPKCACTHLTTNKNFETHHPRTVRSFYILSPKFYFFMKSSTYG